jgi:hypothetical protein
MRRSVFQLVGILWILLPPVFLTANPLELVSQSQPAAPIQAPEPADNSYCYVCHRNFEKETLTRNHTPTGIGCEKCHGLSERHSSDEDGITPPQIMYSKAKIVPFCLSCHPAKKMTMIDSHASFHGITKESKEIPKDGKIDVCTDCHGEHRLKVRTRRWDKETGKLISDDGVRMMEENPSDKMKKK